MERNDDNIGNPGGSTNAGQGASSAPAGAASGAGFVNSGDLTGSTGGTMGASAAGTSAGEVGRESVGDRARDLAGDARERLADTGSSLRERAGSAKNSLADMLEAGANRLNSQGGSTQLAGATGSGAVASDSNRLAAVAGGLQGSADWLREADIDGMREGIENQVRTNPGRSLLVAVGLGYLIGKAFRR